MKFLIISHAEHFKRSKDLLAYAPYVREMNLWLEHTKEVEIVAPVGIDFDDNITIKYQHDHLILTEVPAFSLLGLGEIISTLIKLPGIIRTIYLAMKRSDHIHLRCPGNLGLLGCLVQVFFPSKPKTAKYAGNWDPKAKQPRSYRLQKWILSNTFLTKNIKVLVYGEWPNQSKNIIPFFTASFKASEIEQLYIRNYSKSLHFCFVGSLSPGKQPHKAIELLQQLRKTGTDAVLHIYGDGPLRSEIQKQIKELKAEKWIFIYGNQPRPQIKKALKYSHFLILLSQSEGWPKAVAEAMFFGCVPITSQVSCLPWMLDKGKRGILLSKELTEKDVQDFMALIKKSKQIESMSEEAHQWSTQFTLDKFEKEIAKMLKS